MTESDPADACDPALAVQASAKLGLLHELLPLLQRAGRHVLLLSQSHQVRPACMMLYVLNHSVPVLQSSSCRVTVQHEPPLLPFNDEWPGISPIGVQPTV